jgi:hypothetical protein
VKLPSILWVSVDTAPIHLVHSPFKGLRLIRIVLSLTCALPLADRLHLRFENAASSLSVNVTAGLAYGRTDHSLVLAGRFVGRGR